MRCAGSRNLLALSSTLKARPSLGGRLLPPFVGHLERLGLKSVFSTALQGRHKAALLAVWYRKVGEPVATVLSKATRHYLILLRIIALVRYAAP